MCKIKTVMGGGGGGICKIKILTFSKQMSIDC